MIHILPICLKLKNFTSYADETIDFTSVKSPAIICGDNGNGKSSIIDAITTALYCRARGTDSRGSGIEDLIKKGENSLTVDFTFEMDGHQYQIIRTKSRNGTQKLFFYIDSIEQGTAIKDTQQRIIDAIKIDFETFIDTVCIMQSHSSSFMEKSPDKRKDVFIQILGLNEYEGLEKYTKERRKSLVYDIENKKNKIEDIEKMMSYKEDYEKKLATYKYELTKFDIEALENELNYLLEEKSFLEAIHAKNEIILSQRKNLEQSINRYATRIESSKRELEKLKTSLKEMNSQKKIASLSNSNSDSNESDQSASAIDTVIASLKTDTDNLSSTINEITVQRGQLETKLSFLKKELSEKKEKINQFVNYNSAICEFCGHEITEEYKDEHIAKLKQEGNEIFQKARELKEELNEKLSILENKKEEYSNKVADLNELQRLQKQQLVATERCNSLKETIDNDKLEFKRLNKEMEKNLKEKIVSADTFTILKKIKEIKEKIALQREQKNEYTSKVAILQDRLQMIASSEEEYKRLKEEVDIKLQEVDDYKSLISAFGKSGIQSYIIENALPEIEEEINNILGELTNGTISISFIVQKETKAKTMMDTLEIMVNDGSVVRKYETFSGGEKFRIDFSCHVGMSRFLTKRADANIDLFILDENLGSQDETAKQIFIQCMSRLTKYFKKILIITHISDIKDAFEHRITVSKDKTGSHIAIS